MSHLFCKAYIIVRARTQFGHMILNVGTQLWLKIKLKIPVPGFKTQFECTENIYAGGVIFFDVYFGFFFFFNL